MSLLAAVLLFLSNASALVSYPSLLSVMSQFSHSKVLFYDCSLTLCSVLSLFLFFRYSDISRIVKYFTKFSVLSRSVDYFSSRDWRV